MPPVTDSDSVSQTWKPLKLHLVCVLLTGIAAVFLFVASVTPYGHFKATIKVRTQDSDDYNYRNVEQEARLTRLTQCIDNTCTDYKWSETSCGASRVNAALAFVILGAIVSSIAALTVAVAYFFKSYLTFVVSCIASVLAALCCLAGWSITFSLIEENLCDGGHALVINPGDNPVVHMGKGISDSDQARVLSPSYALQIVALGVLCGNAVLAFSAQKARAVKLRRLGFTSVCLGAVFTMCSLGADRRTDLPVFEGVCGCIALSVSIVTYIVSECSCWQKIAKEDEPSTKSAADGDNAKLRRIGVGLTAVAIVMIIVALDNPRKPGLRALAFIPLALAIILLFFL